MPPKPCMNNGEQRSLEDLADTLALRVQELRSKGLLKETETLLNLDYTSQAAQAPFVFDMAGGILHRNHCNAVPHGSRSTLYAVWELREGDETPACPICSPRSGEQPQVQTESALDLFFGILSFVDQFSSILRERGKQYRHSHRESPLVFRVEKLISWLRPLRAGVRRIIGH
jgi:hypothetical protein